MDMEKFKSFISQLFTELSNEHSIVIITFLLGSFLIGLLFGWWQGRRGKRKLRKLLKEKEGELITLQATHTSTQEQLELKEADLTKANLTIEELKTEISKIEHEKAQMRGSLYETNTELEKMKAENLNNLSHIEELNTQVVKLETSYAQQEELIETAAANVVSDVDLSQVQNNYDSANLRLAAIEEKLLKLETENYSLKSEISSLKDTSSIAFVDDDPIDEEEELIVEDISEVLENEDTSDADERAAIAKQRLKAALGSRIIAATVEDKDDLKKINGIGPFIEQKLNDIGIYTFKQISQFDSDLVQQVTDAIQFFPGRIDRDDWVGQAKELV